MMGFSTKRTQKEGMGAMDKPSGSILAKLAWQHDSFTRAEKRITDYILSNKTAAQYMTISELAEKSGVSDATLTRFCRRLGCKGFADFKLVLAKDCAAVPDRDPAQSGGIRSTDTIEELCQKLCNANREALAETRRLIDPRMVSGAVDLLRQARRVCCCGQGGSSIMAMEAWGRFVTVTNKVQWIQDSHMQAMSAALLEKDDVILFFSFSGATSDLMDIARMARERSVHLILVTGARTAPAAEYADIVLLCGVIEGPLQMGSVAAKISQLYLIDVLFNEFCRRDPEQAGRNQAYTADAISGKYL